VYSHDNKQYILETKQSQTKTKTKIHEKTKVQETQFLYAILHLTECNLQYTQLGREGQWEEKH